MFRSILIISLLICTALYAGDSEVLKGILEEQGFSQNDILYKRDYSMNDTFTNALADTMLNNPYKLLDNYQHIADSVLNDSMDSIIYCNTGFPQIIQKYCNDMNALLRSNIELPFEKAEYIVENASMFFYEESLSYAKKGIINTRYDAEYDTSAYNADSVLTMLSKSVNDYSSAQILTQAMFARISRMYSEGEIMPMDTMLDCGRLYVGSMGDDEYVEQYDFIIDLGGNDTYLNQCGTVYPYTRRVKFIMDFSGNDLYTVSDSFTVSYGSINGVSAMYDLSGDDIYKGSMLSLGSAFTGFSLLIDIAGNDTYTSGMFSQGAGFFGTGILKDYSGNDTYTAACFAQGFGFVNGTGALMDNAGDDIYRAGTFILHEPLLKDDYLSMSQGFGFGIRPRAGGGLGILFDRSGNDIYHSSVFGQGASYWHSLGILIDSEGNDYYSSAEYAQGSGIHLSAGILCDCAGDDMYYSRYGPSQGEGHDYGLGILIDRKGDDNYTVSGGQGVGLSNSVGIMLEYEGNDNYHNYEHVSNGEGTLSRSYWGTGIFADMEGNDHYDISHAEDSLSIINHYYSIFIDRPYMKEEMYDSVYELDSLTAMDSLFDIAAEWAVRENAVKVKNAREILKSRYVEAFDYIIKEKLITDSGLELRAISDLLSACTDSMKGILIDSLRTSDEGKRNNIIYLLGEIKYEPAFSSLKSIAMKEKERPQLLSVIALGNTGKGKDMHFLEKLINSSDERLSIYVLEALKKTESEPAEYTAGIISSKFGRNIRYAAADYIADYDAAVKFAGNMKDIYEKFIMLYMYIERHDDYDEEVVKELIVQDENDNEAIKQIKGKILLFIEHNDD